MFSEEFFKTRVPLFGPLIRWMGSNDMDYGPLAAAIAFSLFVIGLVAFGISAGNVFAVFVATMPLWLPVILFVLFFNKWTDMIGTAFALSQGRTTLRLRLPPEVFKSPEAMEFVISQIHNTASPDNLFQTYVDGKRPLPYSFELASIGGEVRLYMNVPTKKIKNAVEANLYAQYPGIEVIEEPVDYAAEIPLDYAKAGYELMAFHIGKKRDQALPVKTYIDYGLDKLPKEEQKVDPMTPMIEVIANIKPYERIFIQIIATPFRKSSFKNGQLKFSEGADWTEDAKKKINELLNRDPKSKLPVKKKDTDIMGQMTSLTGSEQETIKAMERHMGKYAYETAIRFLYITRQGKFNGDIISPILRSFSQYDIIGRNEIGPRWRTDFNYKDYIPGKKKKALQALKKQELKEYRLRAYAPKSGADAPKIFTAEELATMFHMPGKVALTPTLDRVPSARGEAPANLPVGSLPE